MLDHNLSFGHVLWILFNWPSGIVLGNLLASLFWVLLAAFGMWVFREHIGRMLIAWLAEHHAAHLARAEKQLDQKSVDTR